MAEVITEVIPEQHVRSLILSDEEFRALDRLFYSHLATANSVPLNAVRAALEKARRESKDYIGDSPEAVIRTTKVVDSYDSSIPSYLVVVDH